MRLGLIEASAGGEAVLRIRIRRIRLFLGLLDPDPLVTRADPDPGPSIIKQKYLVSILIPVL